MSRLKKMFVICLLILSAMSLISLAASQALTQSQARPAQGSGEQTLQALLSEVHELRVTMQRANLNTYHAQITIERMKLQQQRVDRLNSQLNDIRHQLADTRKTLSQMSAVIKNAENAVTMENDAAKRATREEALQAYKAEFEEMTQREQQQHEAEIQLNAQLQAEQARLTELNDRLDTLRRELETQMSTDKPQPSGKGPEKN